MEVFAVKHKDKTVVDNSRSGGIFTALSDLFLEEGKVYGCILNEKLEAVHIGTSDITVRNKMRGSKYVQSNLGDCFSSVLEDLNNNKKVMFSGTSCQIAGLKCFLQKDYPNLLCVDIVCHGVPSPKVFKSYLESYGTVSSIDFRNKKDFGWRDHVETLTVGDKRLNRKIWANIFYSGNALRPSCYECQYKSTSHPGDITIADYWGIEKVAPEFDDNNGVSLVLINTDKGKKFFDNIKNAIDFKVTNIEDSMQRAFIRAEYRPETREQFWSDFETKSFKYVVQRYGGQTSIIRKCFRKIKSGIKMIIKK
ncbi:Coenzyme F420 hydrogenase/dehydrogenase, beta subunit N-term [Lachnospiraceae bacterium]|nr:Coenzyme F420 hydrogenase/dehydrogenase, beta subunit N-term [Lachnospiraceae bacterium]